jgi:hypothetical protein
MSAEETLRLLHGAFRRLRSAKWDLGQVLGPAGEFPSARRQVLEAIEYDVIVAARLINKVMDSIDE